MWTITQALEGDVKVLISGSLMSRATRSGSARSISSIASAPVAASPDTSISMCLEKPEETSALPERFIFHDHRARSGVRGSACSPSSIAFRHLSTRHLFVHATYKLVPEFPSNGREVEVDGEIRKLNRP